MFILFIANDVIPTLQLSFLVPLVSHFESKKLGHAILTERDIKRAMKLGLLSKTISAYSPDVIVFCRYSGGGTSELLAEARSHDAATIFHIDDDLLNIPASFGEKKFKFHNDPERLSAVRALLEDCDLVYVANDRLADRLRKQVTLPSTFSGKIYCSSKIFRVPSKVPTGRIGYMGFDHGDDFELVTPAIVNALNTYPNVTFTMLGPIPIPAELSAFGDRVRAIEPIRDYNSFRQRLADEAWDIGLCPLLDTPFNVVKSDTKWVEYTSSGTATIASAGTIYDQCCADDCGVLVENRSDAWIDALQGLLMNDARRYAIAQRAQEKVRVHYAPDVLTRQVQDVLQLALKVRSEKTASADV